MKQTYLFYDIETTGLNPCFDQVLQFAAIRTDLELKELERYELQVKLNDDVVPSPTAILTHGIGMQQCQRGISEIAAIQQIHQWFNQPGTITLGYKTLGFDDEFLRFSFYRNLLSPYTHQFANGCSRMDLYPLTVMYYLFKPTVLAHWPERDQQITLKLEYLSAANQLATGAAHTAIVDVEATLALAKKLLKEREIWDYLTGFFDKSIDIARMSQLSQQAIMVSGKFGAKQNYLAPVLQLGQHEHYKNQTVWLRLDTDNLTENAFVIRKKTAENVLLLPMKPRYLEKITADRQQLAQKNWAQLQQNPQILTTIANYHRQFTFPKHANVDADAALYDINFPSRAEEQLFQQFHSAPAAKKMATAAQFSNSIRQHQALRLMGRHFTDSLNITEQVLYQEYLQQALHGATIDYRGQNKLTIPMALAEIAQLNYATLATEQQNLIAEFNDFYKGK
jgi:exodeoxyribonuclease I